MKKYQTLAAGNTATIYRKGSQVIKLFDQASSQEEIEGEMAKQEFAYACGLPVPRVLGSTRINQRPGIIMEYIEGESLGTLLLRHGDRLDHYLDISIELQLKIHQQEATPLESMKTRLKRQIQSQRLLPKGTKEALLDQLEACIFSNRLCHGDFHLHNILQAEDGYYMIDWADGTAGEPKLDVCRTYLIYTQYSPDLARLYLQTYTKKSGILEEEILAYLPILAGARLSEGLRPRDEEKLLEFLKEI